jgi:hypothetical protein
MKPAFDPDMLSRQIAEVEREIALRRAVYPRLIAQGMLRRPSAWAQLGDLRAAARTLKWLRRNARRLRRGPGGRA